MPAEQSLRISALLLISTQTKAEVVIVKNTFGRLAASALACAGLFIGIASGADAKVIAWQAHSGGRANDAGRGGVAQTSDGGLITVGESQSFGAGDYDVYMVKTDWCGRFVWAATYDIGGNDYGRKVKVTPDGGYIITGMTQNSRNCCTPSLDPALKPRYDAFLMKISPDGAVEWTKTYGGRGDDRGTDVELFYGGERGYILSGSTTSFGAGSSDGWLIATDPAGNVAWSRVYGGAAADGFNGLVQTATGDIVATGSTNSYAANDPVRSGNDIFLVRTTDAGNVRFSYHYGTDESVEVGNSVIEYRTDLGGREGDLIVAGYSTVAVGKGSAYLLRVHPDLTFVIDHLHGSGNEKGRDEFRDLVQSPWNEDIFVIGCTFEPVYGLGSYDVLAMKVNGKLDNIGARVYGGKDNDQGYGICADDMLGGFAWNGVTSTFTHGLEDQYLGISYSTLESYCEESEPKLTGTRPNFTEKRAPTGEPMVWVQCDARVEASFTRGYKLLCSTCGLDEEKQDDSGNELSFRSPLRAPGAAVVRTYERAADGVASAR